MPVKSVRFGPGTFKLGTAPGTDYSCQVQSMGLVPTKDEGEAITTLCGESIPGSINYTYGLEGVLLQDYATGGISQYAWTNRGKSVPFEFVPNTAGVAKWAGNVIVDPLEIGTSDGALGDVLVSDIAWSVVGEPTPTWPP
jgi:hypothetical protein